jgi:hypothetical protein
MRGIAMPPIRLGTAHDAGAGEAGGNPAWITDKKSAGRARHERERETIGLYYKLLPYLGQAHTHVFTLHTLVGSGKWASQVCNEWGRETTQFGSITHVNWRAESKSMMQGAEFPHGWRSDLVLSP